MPYFKALDLFNSYTVEEKPHHKMSRWCTLFALSLCQASHAHIKVCICIILLAKVLKAMLYGAKSIERRNPKCL